MLESRHGCSDLDLACDASLRILRDRGAQGLSLRAIAGELRVTGPALSQRWDSRARLVGLVVTALGERRVAWLDDRVRADGLLGMLPTEADDVVDARAWLGLCDLGRADPVLAARLGLVKESELRVIDLALGLPARYPGRTDPNSPAVVLADAVDAVASGLLGRMVCLESPLSADQARARFRRVLACLKALSEYPAA